MPRIRGTTINESMGVYCDAHELSRGCLHTSLDTQFGARNLRIFVQGQHENLSRDKVECDYFHSKIGTWLQKWQNERYQ